MVKTVTMWFAILITLAGWPISLYVDRPKLETEMIWQLTDAEEEKKLLTQKLGLDASPIKRIFYNSKTTIRLDRYTRNVLAMTDLNNYFFSGHPQSSVTDTNTRMKFPYPAIFGLLAGIYLSVKEKKYLKMWLVGVGLILLVSLFRNIDGWDTLIYPILGIITAEGYKKISCYKFGWLLMLLIVIISLTEIWRLFL
jgi:hypothetical protein